MKKFLQVTLILITTLSASCQVIDFNQDGLNNQGEESNTLKGPTTVPENSAQIEQLLHNGSTKTWDADAFTLFGFSGFLPCRLDDLMIISQDGTYLYNGGSSLCGAEDNQRTKEGTWRLSDDRQQLIFTEGDNEHVAELLGITEQEISLRGDYRGLEINAVYTSF